MRLDIFHLMKNALILLEKEFNKNVFLSKTY